VESSPDVRPNTAWTPAKHHHVAKQEISSEWNMQIGRCVEGDHRYILQMLYKNIQNEIQQYDRAAAAAPK